MSRFQPTRPLRGATNKKRISEPIHNNFNPRAPCGARQQSSTQKHNKNRFQPTRPLRGATLRDFLCKRKRGISTHAPLAGRDVLIVFRVDDSFHFNPRAPCGARRGASPIGCGVRIHFNPRAPCGARPCESGKPLSHRKYFNPRAPCGARLNECCGSRRRCIISTHAPLAGRDFISSKLCTKLQISTHAPLAGRDSTSIITLSCSLRISTHAPLAGRDQIMSIAFIASMGFQPTRPLRGATAKVYKSLCTFLR